MDAKRITTGIMAGLLAATLLAGCGGGGGKSSGGSGQPPAKPAATGPAVPQRAAVSTAPAMTFNFAGREAKVYEIKGDATKDIKSIGGNLVATKDAIYVHGKQAAGGDNTQYLWKVAYSHENLTGAEPIAPSLAVHFLATNGKDIYFQDADHNFAVYDGKTVRTGKKWDGNVIFGAPDGGKDVYYVKNGSLMKFPSDDAAKSTTIFEGITVYGAAIAYADGKEFYVRGAIKQDGSTKEKPILIAYDAQGKELRRFEGVEELPRDWTVTTNYIIHAGSKGVLRIFDRATGNKLDEVTIKVRPFELFTVTGNDVIMYDDRAKKLYRIDF